MKANVNFKIYDVTKLVNKKLQWTYSRYLKKRKVKHAIKFSLKIIQKRRYIVGNKATGRISKRVFKENKTRQIFRKTNIFQKISRTLFSWNTRFEIQPFALLPATFCFLTAVIWSKKKVVKNLVSIFIGSPWLRHAVKTNCVKLQTIDPEICSKLF